MAKKTGTDKDYWLDNDIQPCVMAGIIRQYKRFREVDSHQIDHEIEPFNDFMNQIIVAGMVAYEQILAELEKKMGI